MNGVRNYYFTKKTMTKSLLFLLLLLSFTRATVDWFDAIDTNHDGSITRAEYDEAMLKIQATVSADLPKSLQQPRHWVHTLTYGSGSFWKGFTSGVAMIIATEIGDKTFFIAAVLSMRHDRSAVFCGAILALIIMTILSSAMGLVLPQFVDRHYTHILGGILFLYFGVKLMLESKHMQANRVSEELEEVEEELLHPKKDEEVKNLDDDEEQLSNNVSNKQQQQQQLHWYQIVLQALTLTFLAEWGDRSQIATIALSAAKNPVGVTVGGCLGHAFCTGLAVLGGRMLAARISEKTVAFWGGIIFLVFGFHSIFLEE
jgi:putative Ca2+/H+ antiporter (TMEM165/GDT1 family)